MTLFRWEPTLYKTAASSQICDIDGHRLHASRDGKGSRKFYAAVDGKRVGTYDSIDSAKRAAEDMMSIGLHGTRQ